jgi:hypothetical protein
MRRENEGGQEQVGIWIRVSTEDQAKGESPEHHEHRARLYAEARGWRVREVYHFEVVSESPSSDRPDALGSGARTRTLPSSRGTPPLLDAFEVSVVGMGEMVRDRRIKATFVKPDRPGPRLFQAVSGIVGKRSG